MLILSVFLFLTLVEHFQVLNSLFTKLGLFSFCQFTLYATFFHSLICQLNCYFLILICLFRYTILWFASPLIHFLSSDPLITPQIFLCLHFVFPLTIKQFLHVNFKLLFICFLKLIIFFKFHIWGYQFRIRIQVLPK